MVLGFIYLLFGAHTDIGEPSFIASTATVESSSRSRAPGPTDKLPLPTAPVYSSLASFRTLKFATQIFIEDVDVSCSVRCTTDELGAYFLDNRACGWKERSRR